MDTVVGALCLFLLVRKVCLAKLCCWYSSICHLKTMKQKQLYPAWPSWPTCTIFKLVHGLNRSTYPIPVIYLSISIVYLYFYTYGFIYVYVDIYFYIYMLYIYIYTHVPVKKNMLFCSWGVYQTSTSNMTPSSRSRRRATWIGASWEQPLPAYELHVHRGLGGSFFRGGNTPWFRWTAGTYSHHIKSPILER